MGQVKHALDQLDLLTTELSNANRRLPLGNVVPLVEYLSSVYKPLGVICVQGHMNFV